MPRDLLESSSMVDQFPLNHPQECDTMKRAEMTHSHPHEHNMELVRRSQKP